METAKAKLSLGGHICCSNALLAIGEGLHMEAPDTAGHLNSQ